MQSSIPAMHTKPPDTIDTRFELIDATQPARTFPISGPLR